MLSGIKPRNVRMRNRIGLSTMTDIIMIWENLSLDTPKPHTWAFYYFLKRCGDEVKIFNKTEKSLSLIVRVRNVEGEPM